jgi:hypothetical protein
MCCIDRLKPHRRTVIRTYRSQILNALKVSLRIFALFVAILQIMRVKQGIVKLEYFAWFAKLIISGTRNSHIEAIREVLISTHCGHTFLVG